MPRSSTAPIGDAWIERRRPSDHSSENPPLISTLVSRASAGFLLLAGIVLLFAPDVVLPRLVAGFPPTGAWIGAVLASALLGLGALTWLARSQLLGGIYGRPVVSANATFYFIAAIELLKVAGRREVSAALWVVAILVTAFACVYGWLLLRGPFERDFQASRNALGSER